MQLWEILLEDEFTVVPQGTGKNRVFNVVNPRGDVIGSYNVPGSARAEAERRNIELRASQPTNSPDGPDRTTTDPAADNDQARGTRQDPKGISRINYVSDSSNNVTWEVKYNNGDTETRKGTWDDFNSDQKKHDPRGWSAAEKDAREQIKKLRDKSQATWLGKAFKRKMIVIPWYGGGMQGKAGLVGIALSMYTIHQCIQQIAFESHTINKDRAWPEIWYDRLSREIPVLAELLFELVVGAQFGAFLVARSDSIRMMAIRNAQQALAREKAKKRSWSRIFNLQYWVSWLVGFVSSAILLDYIAEKQNTYSYWAVGQWLKAILSELVSSAVGLDIPNIENMIPDAYKPEDIDPSEQTQEDALNDIEAGADINDVANEVEQSLEDQIKNMDQEDLDNWLQPSSN